MKMKIKSLLIRLCALVMLASVFSYVSPVLAKGENEVKPSFFVYESTGKKSKYLVDVSTKMGDPITIGRLSVNGDKLTELKGNTYTVKSGNVPSIVYNFDLSLLGEGWEIIDDDTKTVNGEKFDTSVGKVSVLIQLSRDGEKWVDEKTFFNVLESSESSRIQYDTNDIQMSNGCYYRVYGTFVPMYG